MSGGSYGYAYRNVQDFAEDLRDTHTNTLRKTFQEHLQKVARAMHAIEWVDSGDYGPGDEDELIRQCLAPGAELESARAMAQETLAMLEAAVERSKP